MPPKSKSPESEFERDMLPQRSFFLEEKAEWGGFINVRVDDQERLLFEEWYENNPQLPALILQELVSCGVKVTLAYDPENAAWLCSFTGRLVSERADRYVTTSRAGSMPEVIALACWKHVYLVRGLYHPYSNSKKPLWG